MNFYPCLRPLLFRLDPETAHHITLQLLQQSYKLGISKLLTSPLPDRPVQVMGLNFKNPVGLAAGLDKNGDFIDPLAALGFGFIEVGTITPRAQPGNPKPRLFRLPEHQAIINRMGFNNQGIEHLISQVKQRRYQGILGINIGKNFDTPISEAAQDYLYCLQKAYPHADYITVNISSPNTKNLRQLQQGDQIKSLLQVLKQEQQKLEQQHNKFVPLVLKIAPDLTPDEIITIAQLLKSFEIDAVIATNTTISRDAIKDHPLAKETGGLSGTPVKNQATEVVRILSEQLNGEIPIIAAGGIISAKDATEKLEAGASLVQVYSGLIYKGPQLVEDIVKNCKI